MPLFDSKILETFSKELEERATETVAKHISYLDQRIDEAKKLADKALTNKPFVVKLGKEELGKVERLKHALLENLIRIVHSGHHALLVGMAGSGKTQSTEQVAQALGLTFAAMSVGAQTTKSDIMGFINANGVYVPSLFRKQYEHGGVFLMDEIDAGNANVLIQINSALANGQCGFPDGMVKMHENFRFVGTANTYGTGADRMYVGRNVLDSATLDRFTIIDWPVDENLEFQIIAPYGDKAIQWHKIVRKMREWTLKNKVPALITPRTTIKGARLLASGFSMAEVAEICVSSSYPKDKVEQLKQHVKNS